MRSLVVVVVLAACTPEIEVVECSNGWICPSHLTCSPDPEVGCLDPNAHCVGKPAGEACTPKIGGDGTCDGMGLCIPVTCGDNIVEGHEDCDGSLAQSCTELGYDRGRTRCAADCSGPDIEQCGHLGWIDLRLYLEAVEVNDVAITGEVVWAAGDRGIYQRAEGSWTRVHSDPWDWIVAISPSDVWAFADGTMSTTMRTIHFDGTSWTEVPWVSASGGDPPRWLSFAEASDGTVVIAELFTRAIYRRVAGQWVQEEDAFPASGVLAKLSAFANLGGTEVLTMDVVEVGGFPPTVGTAVRVFERPIGGTWSRRHDLFTLGAAKSIVGSATDYVIAGWYFPFSSNSTRYRAVRVQPGTTAILAGGGVAAATSEGTLILPDIITASGDPDPSVVGVWRHGDQSLPVEVPDRVTAVASSGDRLVIAVGTDVFELGDGLWSPPIPVTDASTAPPELTTIVAADMSYSPDHSRLYVLDRRPQPTAGQNAPNQGLVWSVNQPYGTSPTATEQTRQIADLVGIWGYGGGFATVTRAGHAHHYVGNSSTSSSDFPLLDMTPLDLAGISATDMMVVGHGDVAARRFDGVDWTLATTGLVAGVRLNAVVGVGNDRYVTAGDEGTLAWFDGRWHQLEVNTLANLHAVDGIGADAFVATGDRVAVRCSLDACSLDEIDGAPRHVAMRAADDVFAVGGDAFHFDGVGWSRLRLAMRPSFVAVDGSIVWFADTTGRVERLVRVRAWK